MKTLINLLFISLLFSFGVLFSSCEYFCFDCNTARYMPPLHKAASNGDIKEVKRLLDEGVSVDSRKEYNQWTALHYASLFGHADMVSFLIQNKASVDVKSNTGYTPLYLSENVEVAKILLENKAKIDVKTNSNWTPLHRAIRKKKTELALFFINKGADMHNQNKNIRTPFLYMAVQYDEKEVAKLLFKKGANPYVKDKSGDSAMSVAKERDYQELVQLFETYNSNSSKNVFNSFKGGSCSS